MISGMKRWRRLFFYLLLNVLVSACTILVVLYLWEQYRSPVLEPLELGRVFTIPTDLLPTQSLVENSLTATPATALESYEVQPGDSLSGIAARFGVTVEEILALNPIDNPDSLDVGDILLIPVPIQASLENEPTSAPATPVAIPSPVLPADGTPLPAGIPAEVEIVAVVGAGDLEEERVVIRFNGEGQISLLGWELYDPDGNRFSFPQLVLFKDGAVTVYSKSGNQSVVELFWELSAPVWGAGENATLTDSDGAIISVYAVP